MLRSFAVAFVGFGGVGLLALVGARAFGVTGSGVEAWLSGFSDSPWGLTAAIALFAALAFIGAPQFVLIAAAVAAFGPWRGAAYSWAGTMVSAALGFGLGRRFAAQLIRAHAGSSVARFMRLVGRNGLLASLMVRLAPSAPFVLVNMAAGATPMAFADFLWGTALGIVPKIVICAIGTAGAGRAMGQGGAWGLVAVVMALGLWAGLGWGAKAWARRWRGADDARG